MARNDAMAALRNVWLFEHCTRKELSLLVAHSTAVDAPAGKVLAREGAPGEEFFVLTAGKAEATRNGVTLGVFGPGSFFGEMSLLDRKPRTASIATVEPSTVLVLTKQAFTSVVSQMPSVDHKMLAVLAARLRDVEERFLPANERIVTHMS